MAQHSRTQTHSRAARAAVVAHLATCGATRRHVAHVPWRVAPEHDATCAGVLAHAEDHAAQRALARRLGARRASPLAWLALGYVAVGLVCLAWLLLSWWFCI